MIGISPVAAAGIGTATEAPASLALGWTDTACFGPPAAAAEPA